MFRTLCKFHCTEERFDQAPLTLATGNSDELVVGNTVAAEHVDKIVVMLAAHFGGPAFRVLFVGP